MTSFTYGYSAANAQAGSSPNWPGVPSGAWSFNWTVPTNLINGAILFQVFGSPGQNSALGGTPSGEGLGAFIQGYVPCSPGDQFQINIADGGPTGYSGHGYHTGGLGGVGAGTGGQGGRGGSSTSIFSITHSKVFIEAAGGGGDGGFRDNSFPPFLSGVGAAAGGGTGLYANGQTGPNAAGGNEANAGIIFGGNNATAAGPGGPQSPPVGGIGFGEAGAPLGVGPNTGGAGGPGGTADALNDGGGGGGGGGGNPDGSGNPWGGGGAAGGYGVGGVSGSGGGGGGAGGSVVDPTVYGVSYAGYSGLYGSVLAAFSTADAPFVPVLMQPGNNAYADLAGQGNFTFQYLPAPDSGAINAWAFRRQNVTISGPIQYWDAVNLVWSSTVVWNDASLLNPGFFYNIWGYSFPQNEWIDGDQYVWSVATQESFYGLQGAFATNYTVNAQVAPKPTSVTPSGFVATVTPTVSWTDILAPGTTATQFNVRIYTLTQTQALGFSPLTTPAFIDSGLVSSGATSWPVSSPVPPGFYVVYVFLIDNHGVQSIWGQPLSFSSFFVRLITYTQPAFTVTPGQDPDNATPCTVITVTPSDSPAAISVERSLDFGGTWYPVFECWMVPFSSGSLVLYDRTAPIGKPLGPDIFYRVEENGTTVIGGITYDAVSDWNPGTNSFAQLTAPAPLPGGGTPSVTITRGVNDTFVWTPKVTGLPELFYILPGTYDTNGIVDAMNDAQGNQGDQFSNLAGVGFTTVGGNTYLTLAAYGFGTSNNGDAISFGPTDAAHYLGFTGNPNVLSGGSADDTIRLPVFEYDGYPGGWWLSDPMSGGGAETVSFVDGFGQYVNPPQGWGGGLYAGAGSIGLHRIAGTAGGGTTAPSGGIQDYETSVSVDQSEQQSTVYPFGRAVPITVRGDLYAEIFSGGINMIFFGQQEFDSFNQLRGRQNVLCLRTDMGQVYFGILGPDRSAILVRSMQRTEFPLRQLGVIFTPADPPVIPNGPPIPDPSV